MMKDHLWNRICKWHFPEKLSEEGIASRLKPNLQKKDENQLRSAMNSLSIPSTPVNQKGIFAILEQPVSTITSHSTEPVFNYKSKQVTMDISNSLIW